MNPLRWRAVAALLLALLALPAFAQAIPPLTGRVVDTAGLLDAQQSAALDAKLAALETATGHQLVVATVPDLQGYPIESVGIKMLRDWGIGDKARDDGVILLIAKNDRKLRIEVGYGLEPLLTDAWSSLIINQTITPRFKAGDFAGGIDAGVDAIAEQIKLTPEEAAKRTAAMEAERKKGDDKVSFGGVIFWLFIFFFVIMPILGSFRRGGRVHRSGLGEAILWTAINAAANSRSSSGGSGWSSGGGSDWGGGGSDFSGGGGSGGGGGASGGW